MVCYMYYTDVFVGSNDIDKLNNALEAELNGSELTDLNAELDALASGLGSFIGYSGGSVNGSGIGKNDTGGSQYASSFLKSATWEKLCKDCKCKTVSKSSCSNCSCGSQTVSSVCDPSKCCADCDVRKAAKIFLGFLPCLYYGLKFLKEKCEVDWKDFLISQDNSLRRFLVGMGYNLGKLDENKQGSDIFGLLSSLFTGSNPLPNLYEKSKKYFTSSSHSPVPSPDSPSQPKTVREILLWLYGLRFQKGFEALLDHCKDLCDSTQGSVKFNNFESSLFDSCFLSPFVLGVIEGSKSDEESRKFPPYASEWQNFSYPDDPFDLFNMLVENVRKIYIPLAFLKFQCGKGSALAGWQECGFGQECVKKLQGSLQSSGSQVSTSSSCCISSAPKGYLCTSKPGESDVHEHCTKVGASCRGFGQCNNSAQAQAHTQVDGKCKESCPHPLLNFLIADSKSQPKASPSLFKPPPGFPPMGFSPDKLPSPGRHGEALYLLLEAFSTVSSLTRLVKSLICISRAPPETLGELFGFFLQFQNSSVFKSQLNTAFLSWISKEPGRPDAQKFTTAFQTALGKLKGSSHSGSHPYDLRSLSECHVPQGAAAEVTCGQYLNSLTGDVYDIFIDSPDVYLSWICYLPKDFKTLLEEFKQKFSDCCSSGKCPKIVECPCALPLIYSQGFQFMSPNDLNGGTPKKCSDFLDQLGKVLEENSPLGLLIKAIDAFLWSIRLPFVYTFLYIWILVISYFYYVQFYKLDLLHIDSHLHLPRSFKILPSTLFSDASSRLKDLSYFSL
ncbi:variant erythrocyte surface antigen-1 family protein [Babesia divergens]|uniref:Variant erythrocyte surface antigen-1 family protein n=1 Tax=Babesia divergens TaxID=32595 RepID=A0AAD9GBD4_BABDI|nr:variant erythrocyte surface antigen-1 family protein [Babesia divergens]